MSETPAEYAKPREDEPVTESELALILTRWPLVHERGEQWERERLER